MVLARAQIAKMVSGANMVLTLGVLQDGSQDAWVPCVPDHGRKSFVREPRGNTTICLREGLLQVRGMEFHFVFLN